MSDADLIEQLRVELDALKETLLRLTELDKDLQGREPSHVELTAAAAYLANLYAGLERILVRIATHAGLSPVAGSTWHRELLLLFRDDKTSRLPPLVDGRVYLELAPFLGFRHVFVHGYAVRLDWTKLRVAARSAPALFARLIRRVEEFLEMIVSRKS